MGEAASNLAYNHAMSVEIVKGYLPGAIGRVAELHANYYHAHCGFGLYFESKVAGELSEFLRRYDDARDGLWLALVNGRIEGSVAMDGIHADEEGVHLRWFIVSDRARGTGLAVASACCPMPAPAQVWLLTTGN